MRQIAALLVLLAASPAAWPQDSRGGYMGASIGQAIHIQNR